MYFCVQKIINVRSRRRRRQCTSIYVKLFLGINTDKNLFFTYFGGDRKI